MNSTEAPSIKRTAWKLSNNGEVYNRLHQTQKIHIQNIMKLRERQNSKDMSKCTFSPKINSNKNYNRERPRSQKVILTTLHDQGRIKQSKQEQAKLVEKRKLDEKRIEIEKANKISDKLIQTAKINKFIEIYQVLESARWGDGFISENFLNFNIDGELIETLFPIIADFDEGMDQKLFLRKCLKLYP